jgi:hypothetical protein
MSGARLSAIAALAAALAACHAPRPEPTPGLERRDLVRIAPTRKEGGEELRRPDPAQASRDLAKRFPGLESIDFLRVLVAPEEHTGRCWPKVPPPWETKIDVDYSIDGKRRTASGVEELKKQGWWPTYRAPEGQGVEQRAPFDAVDLRLATTLTCECTASEGVRQGDAEPVELRFRWRKSQMPEVSVSVETGGRASGLSPAITYGHLLTYDFEAKGAFPIAGAGRCAAHFILSILAEPPIV